MRPWIAAVVALIGSHALAQEATAYRHTGAYVHLGFGGGYLVTSVSARGADFSLYGGAGQLEVSIGGAVTENLIIAGRLWGVGMVNPTFTLNGLSAGALDVSTSLGCLGPELIYYLMPANIYFSGTVGLSRLSVTTGGHALSTDAGAVMQTSFGKEWWVSRHWGIGVAGQLTLALNKDSGSSDAIWATVVPSIAFSTTFN